MAASPVPHPTTVSTIPLRQIAVTLTPYSASILTVSFFSYCCDRKRLKEEMASSDSRFQDAGHRGTEAKAAGA